MPQSRRKRRRPTTAADRRRRRPSLEFSLTGLIYVGLMMFMGLAAVNSQANLLFGVFGLMIGVLIVSIFISRLVLSRLQVVRVLPDHVVVGRPVTAQYEITNRKRFWPTLSITITERDAADAFTRPPLAYMMHAAPGMTAVVPAELVPRRRGLFQFDRHIVSTSFPFGFIRRASQRRQTDSLVIYPAIGQVDPKLLNRFQAAEKSGAMLRPRRGGQDEFYGVKEYRRGENPRWIYWKRSARTGTLVTREMTLVTPPRIILLVDTHCKDDSAQEREQVERAIAMAGSLASHALEAGIMVGLYAWSGHWVSIIPNRGKRHAREIMTALACLQCNKTHSVERLLDNAGELIKNSATPVLMTPRDLSVGLSETARGGLVVLSAATPEGRAWFTFDPSIDFAGSAPEESNE